MANIKSQKKRILTNAKAQDRNKAVKSELRTRIRTATASLGTPEGEADTRLAIKRIDMAAAKGTSQLSCTSQESPHATRKRL